MAEKRFTILVPGTEMFEKASEQEMALLKVSN